MRREEIITKYVRDRDVLDLGGIDHSFMDQKVASNDWLHAIIARNARSCLGVDILEDRIREVNSLGYHFVTGNAENLPFENQFDVVVAGEFVEHVYNIGLVFDGIWRALRPSGYLIVTTPNNFSLSKLLYAMLLGRECCHPEHTCWYSRQTLTYVLSTHGFKCEETHVLPRKARYKALGMVYEAVARWRPILAETLVIVARRENTQDKYGHKW